MIDTIKANAARWAAFGAYFFFCFLLSCYLTFPYGRVRDWLQEQAAKYGSSGRETAELQIGTLEPSWLTGVELTDVRFIRSAPTDTDGPNVVEFDELSLRASALAAIVGDIGVSFRGEGGGGTVEGSFEKADDGMAIEAILAGLDVRALGLTSIAGLPIRGTLTGEVDLDIPKDLKSTTGNIDLVASDLSLGDGKAKLKVPGMRQGFTLERINAGKVDLKVVAADGVVELTKVHSEGADLSLDASGSIRLATKAKRSRLNLTIEAGFSEAYRNRDDKTKALFDLMNFQRKIKQAMTPEGNLRYKIGGTFGVPRATPAGKLRSKSRGSSAKAKKRPSKPRKKE